MKSSSPAEPRRLSFRKRFESDRLEVSIRTGATFVGVFMLVWLSGWTVACGLLIWKVLTEPQFELWLFAIPFWSSWIFVVLFAVQALFGRELFTLDEQGAYYRRRTLLVPWGRDRRPLAELIRFGSFTDDAYDNPGQSGTVLNLRTLGRPIRFGGTLTADERKWLSYTFNQKLYAWQRTTNRKPELPVDARVIAFSTSLPGELLREVDVNDRNRRTPADMPVELPSDSPWGRRDDFDSVRFYVRGSWHLGQIGISSFLFLFTGGIVGAFAKLLYFPEPDERLFGLEWLGKFLFLIPFELLVLVFFLFWFFTVIDPLRVSSWRVARDRIVWKITWLGLGIRKTYPLDGLDRLEVRRGSPAETTQAADSTGSDAARERLKKPKTDDSYYVAVVDRHGKVVVAMNGQSGGFTLGEACWAADSFLRTHPDWFG